MLLKNNFPFFLHFLVFCIIQISLPETVAVVMMTIAVSYAVRLIVAHIYLVYRNGQAEDIFVGV